MRGRDKRPKARWRSELTNPEKVIAHEIEEARNAYFENITRSVRAKRKLIGIGPDRVAELANGLSKIHMVDEGLLYDLPSHEHIEVTPENISRIISSFSKPEDFKIFEGEIREAVKRITH